jgi:muconolactone D-isomerase
VKFLVEIEVRLPGNLPDSERSELLEAELERGRELVDAGVITAIWRIPGALRNVGIWEATDATELHEHLTSLPLFRWLTAEVTPLADHPLRPFLDG